MDSEAHPRAIALAAVRIAAEALKRASEAGTADVRDVDALKKALSELRMVERDYLKLAVERGELVHRDQAAEVAGYLARVAVEALHDIEVRLAAQVMIWLEDPLFREKGQRERERSVKQWAADRVYEVRAQTARDLNDLLGEVA